jgi:DNA helicase-2/ATP-dependent DNA helicase PcrA
MKTKTKSSVESIANLNDEQLAAVRAPVEKPAVVLAGPGSGKTAVLAARYAYLVNEQSIDPGKIVAVTFTTKMAGELLGRIRAIVPEADDRMICTIHAFALRKLKDIGEIKHEQKAKDYVIRREIEEFIQATGWKRSPGSIRWWVEWSKNSGINQSQTSLSDYFSLQMYKLGGTDEDASNLTECSFLIKQKLEQLGLWTYSDLVNRLWQSMRSKNTLSTLRADIDYVLVDEGQDTFELAVKILNKLSPNRFFIVGDPDQTLFRFAGASPENNLFSLAKTAKVFKLNTNYRSTPQIVVGANNLIQYNYQSDQVRDFAKILVAANEVAGDEIHYQGFDTPDEEAMWVAKTIKANFSHYPPGDIFVGARTNAQLVYIEKELVAQKVPYVVFGTQGFFSQGHVRKVVNYIRLAVNEEDDQAFEDIYDISSPLMKSFNGQYAPTRYLGQVFLAETSGGHMTAVRKGQYSNRFRFGARDLINTLDELKNKLKQKLPSSDIVAGVVSLFLQHHRAKVGLVSQDAGQDDNVLDDLMTLVDMAKQYSTIDKFLEFVYDTEEEEKNKDDSKSVALATLHKLKGMERPVVYGIGWSEGLLPHYRALRSNGAASVSFDSIDLPVPILSGVEDERCTAFVLLTRAKTKVYISSIMHYQGRDLEPSRFIGEMFGETKEA